ncbi:MAG: hypothetical protein WAL50_01620 [Kineosporiaceae bacterium]
MAFQVHQVNSYNYSFDASAGGPGRLQLWGDQGKILEIELVDDSAPIPAPTLAADLSSATASFRRSTQPGLVDMLRNESPVSVTINDQPPGFVFVHTGLEPVGPGDEGKEPG